VKSLVRIEQPELSDRAYSALRTAIITGELTAHEELKDRRLAEVLGISRTPVREALFRLQSDGLAVAKPGAGGGWTVSPFTETDVEEIFQIRLLFEPAGIDALATNTDERLLDTLGTFFDSFSKPMATDRTDEYFLRDNEFHKKIVEATRNTRIVRMYSVIEMHVERGRHLADVPRAHETLDEHIAISHALLGRDFAKARELLLRHLASGRQSMLDRLAGS
jgi:DNA-binding GntR family transcriptional regulator